MKHTSLTLLALVAAAFLAPMSSSTGCLYCGVVSGLAVGLGGAGGVVVVWLSLPLIWSTEGRNEVSEENMVVSESPLP
jgi:hypothetical protein